MAVRKETTGYRERSRLYFDVAPGIWGTKDVFVNMYMAAGTEPGTWVLIDTGLKSSAARITQMAETLFGKGVPPTAILLTHGHFDHSGSVKRLLKKWPYVPVYCHYLELPYLSGRSGYPPADPSVGGGLFSTFSWMYPRHVANIEPHLRILPPDGSVPALEGWRYIHTPGHAPGHVSFFREKDRVLIAGDAFVTTRQESAMSVMMQQKTISGPPKSLTYDWEAAGHSVNTLSELHPTVAATGHGKPMKGPELQIGLQKLAIQFKEMAMPKKGRYLQDAAVTDASGVRYLPPRPKDPNRYYYLAAAVVLCTGVFTYLLSRSSSRNS